MKKINFLRETLSTEISNRVKLLHEVQDVNINTNVSVDLLLHLIIFVLLSLRGYFK